jgi:sulfane dehydrogenase subunit SoxC
MSPTESPADPDRPERKPGLKRRTFLTGAASLAGLAAAKLWLTPQSAEAAKPKSPTVPDDPTKVPGSPPTPYGQRSAFERTARLVVPSHSLTPLQDLHGIVTPSSLHFERHHNGVPLIDPARHRLLVHGLVERPTVFTMEDLKRFPSVSRLAFIECSGNSGSEWEGQGGSSAQEIHGLFSTSEWTGVPLAIVLREVGARPEAAWMLAEGSDAGAMTRSIPLAAALDEALLCYAQNGEPLRPEHGYPLRLLLPGWEGNACIKWLRRLKLGAEPFMTRDETARYTDLMPDGKARQFTLVMEAKSLITSPSGGQRIRPGFVEIRG